MARSVTVRIPVAYWKKILQKQMDLDLTTSLDAMEHILADYFSGKRPETPESAVTAAVTEAKPVAATAVTALKPPAVTAVTTPVTNPATDALLPAPEEPKSVYGGRIYVVA